MQWKLDKPLSKASNSILRIEWETGDFIWAGLPSLVPTSLTAQPEGCG